jgi:hypothetical protein
MGMTKVAGAELKVGVGTISGMVAQSKTATAGGELREYRDEDGNVFSLYLYDDHEQISFEGLLKASDADALKKKGSTITVDSVTYYISDYQVQYTNNDVSKVSGSARTYPDLASSSNGNT